MIVSFCVRRSGRTVIEVNDWVSVIAYNNGTFELEAYGVVVFEEVDSLLLTGSYLEVCQDFLSRGLWILGEYGTTVYFVDGERLTVQCVDFSISYERSDFLALNQMFCYDHMMILRYEKGLVAFSADVSVKWSAIFEFLQYGPSRIEGEMIIIEPQHEPWEKLCYSLIDGQAIKK